MTSQQPRIRVVICWRSISGYMAACWRALSRHPSIDLFVIAWRPLATSDANFDVSIMEGVNSCLLDLQQRDDSQFVRKLVLERKPDVVAISGWKHQPYNALVTEPTLKDAGFVIGVDNPRKDTLRQRLARLKIGRHLSRIDRIVVAGERSWQFAKFLNIPERKIRRGIYGFDRVPLAPIYEKRVNLAGGWPKSFLFMARYVPVKGIDVMLKAYANYRQSVNDPWPLNCCGTGELKGMISQAQGVSDHGFIQPADQPEVMLHNGVFVLPSLYEPWGVALAEAAGAGLPIICTEACGASVELVRSFYNGLVIATNDVEALQNAMIWCHENHDRLPAMGAASRALAEPFDADHWAERWAEMLQELRRENGAGN